MGWRYALGIGVTLLALAPHAQAANGMIARTPPIYVRAQCITEIDRSVDSTFQLDVGIPFEDVVLSQDEPANSRRFQFFAVCADEHTKLQTLPNWITTEDAASALELDLIDAMPEAADVLDTDPRWGPCAYPLNAADERIPISCEATRAGVRFDTSELPAGNYVVRGYTYEPAQNLWSARRGVVQVRDGDSPMPAVGLSSPALAERIVRAGRGFPIQGCTVGLAGVDVELQWAALSGLGGKDDEAAWRTFATLDAAKGAFDVQFDPPRDALNQLVLIRGVADPGGAQRWVDYAEGSLVVVAGEGESDPVADEPIEFCGFFDQPFEPQGPTTETSGGSPDEEASAEDPGEAGCACGMGPGGRPLSGALLFVLGGLFRRRVRV